jgi:uncharacterized protein YjbI with pentapeptide repeats
MTTLAFASRRPCTHVECVRGLANSRFAASRAATWLVAAAAASCRTPTHAVLRDGGGVTGGSTMRRTCVAIAFSVVLPTGAAGAEPEVINGCKIEPATNCSYAKLEHARLQGASLEDASFHGAVLAAADLRGARLQRVDFQVGNLSHADLRGADLEGAHLFANDLRGAQLQRANLRGVNLQDARLDGANLEGADLTGAILGNVRLDGATWTDGRVCAAGSAGSCR